MQRDREGGDQTSFSTAQLKEALTDPKAILIGVFGFLVTMSAPVIVVGKLYILHSSAAV